MLITILLVGFFVKYSSQTNCWTLYSGSQSSGGVPESIVGSLSSCQSLCLGTAGCRSIEWTLTNPTAKCFFFYITDPPTNQNVNGVDHYISTCFCNWVPYPGQQSFGGTPQPDINDPGKCRERCYYTDNCKAIEWTNSGQPQCFTFLSDATPSINNTAIDHFVWTCSNTATTPPPNPLPGGCNWTSQANTNALGGVVQSNVYSLDGCKYACVQANNCTFGFDWNPLQPLGQQCWLSISNNTVTNQGITHYNYYCNGSVTYTWTVTTDTNSPGGTVQPTALTIDDCKYLCRFTGSCLYGFDWDKDSPIGQQCWLSTPGNLTSYINVDHYTLAATGFGTPSPNDISPCTWYPYQNSNSPNGLPQPSQTTLADCQKNCRLNGCPGIDWDAQGFIHCWFSTNSIVTINTFPGVTHYNYTCPGGVSTTTTTGASNILPTKLGMDCDYVLYVNSGSTGGYNTTFTTHQTCRNQCSVQQSCKAYEWKPTESVMCVFYQTDAPPSQLGNLINHSYFVFRKCN